MPVKLFAHIGWWNQHDRGFCYNGEKTRFPQNFRDYDFPVYAMDSDTANGLVVTIQDRASADTAAIAIANRVHQEYLRQKQASGEDISFTAWCQSLIDPSDRK